MFIYTNGKSIVIINPGFWMMVGEDSVQKTAKKHCFLVGP